MPAELWATIERVTHATRVGVLAFFLFCGATASCRSSESSGVPSAATVRWRGATAELVVSPEHVVVLPASELEANKTPRIVEDAHRRLAYTTASGDVRYVYRVADDAYLGPKLPPPIDFRAAPALDPALGSLFDQARDKRALTRDVAKERGDAAVATMLILGAFAEGPEWNEAFEKLPSEPAASVRKGLARFLEPGGETRGLVRAVAVVPLKNVAAVSLETRVRELVKEGKELRAAAVLLRALGASDAAKAAALGCDLLGHPPSDDALLESAAFVTANAALTRGSTCRNVDAALGDDACRPSFRCGPAGPLSGREPSRQNEPLCDKATLTSFVARELERAPADVLALTGGPRPELFAYATLVAEGRVPPTFETAHARRRYALTQPDKPPCDSVTPAAPCHCDEATLRDQACRRPNERVISVGLCRFEVDDKAKKITNVVATLPP